MMGRGTTSGTGVKAGVGTGMGMGMGPRRTAPLTLVERHAGLLSEIAKKETMVNEMRQGEPRLGSFSVLCIPNMMS